MTANKQEILKKRKLALATVRRGVISEDTIEVVEFLLGPDSYAFELKHLREVCPLVGLTAIPWSPPFVIGVINLRGQIIPIIDIKTFLGAETATRVFNKAIILQKGKVVIGVMADEVLGASKFPAEELQRSLEMLCGITAEFIEAVTRDRLIILKTDKILSDHRLSPENKTPEANGGI